MQNKPAIDLLITGASLVLTCTPAPGDPLGRRAGAAIAIQGETIAAVAPPAELQAAYDLSAAQRIDAAGAIAAPGFVDCHTHLVFGGARAAEYAARMTRSAADVAALGIPTGIQATMNMTRSSPPEALQQAALARLKGMLRCGTTTVESKSGYGLNTAKELELLRANRRLQATQPVDIVSTFLGAHDFPPELPRSRYVDLLVEEMIPAVAQERLAEFCDVYLDEGYYTVEQSRRILQAGLRHGLRPKLHLDAYA
ncbi:MAG: imidazolonepropionase-like domain-containing protein, partial [Chloroflexota bacterium]